MLVSQADVRFFEREFQDSLGPRRKGDSTPTKPEPLPMIFSTQPGALLRLTPMDFKTLGHTMPSPNQAQQNLPRCQRSCGRDGEPLPGQHDDLDGLLGKPLEPMAVLCKS